MSILWNIWLQVFDRRYHPFGLNEPTFTCTLTEDIYTDDVPKAVYLVSAPTEYPEKLLVYLCYLLGYLYLYRTLAFTCFAEKLFAQERVRFWLSLVLMSMLPCSIRSSKNIFRYSLCHFVNSWSQCLQCLQYLYCEFKQNLMMWS